MKKKILLHFNNIKFKVTEFSYHFSRDDDYEMTFECMFCVTVLISQWIDYGHSSPITINWLVFFLSTLYI